MRRAATIVVSALASALATAVPAACSGSTSPPSTTGALTTLPPSTVPPTTATTAAPTPTTVALIPQETPDLAANALFNAWRNQDRHGALQVASEDAVNVLFAQPGEPFADRGCQDPLAGRSSCAIAIGGEAGIAQVVTVTLAGGWVVQSVTVNPNQ